MRQYAASSDGVLASLLASATQQLGDAILWLGTLVGCVALLLLLLHAVGTTTARTCLGPNRFAGTATAGASMLSKVVLLIIGALLGSASAASGCYNADGTHQCDCTTPESACAGTWTSGCNCAATGAPRVTPVRAHLH